MSSQQTVSGLDEFLGKFKLWSSDNFDAFLKEIGSFVFDRVPLTVLMSYLLFVYVTPTTSCQVWDWWNVNLLMHHIRCWTLPRTRTTTSPSRRWLPSGHRPPHFSWSRSLTNNEWTERWWRWDELKYWQTDIYCELNICQVSHLTDTCLFIQSFVEFKDGNKFVQTQRDGDLEIKYIREFCDNEIRVVSVDFRVHKVKLPEHSFHFGPDLNLQWSFLLSSLQADWSLNISKQFGNQNFSPFSCMCIEKSLMLQIHSRSLIFSIKNNKLNAFLLNVLGLVKKEKKKWRPKLRWDNA